MLTVDLFSVYHFSRVDIAFRYIEVDSTFGLPEYVRYMKEFVISRFYSIHFTVTLVKMTKNSTEMHSCFFKGCPTKMLIGIMGSKSLVLLD